MRIPYRTWQIVTLTTMLLAACAQSRPASNPGDADVTDGGESGDSLGLADGEDEGGMDGADAGDPGGDSAGDAGLPPGDSDPCDRDADGYLARSCGGEDCDDDDRFVHPGVTDDCDFVDANCDGNLNDDRECWFYAHTPETLYQVDPFRQTAVEVTEVPSYMWDVDTHPNGTLYGVGNFGLYKYDEQDGWDLLGDDNLGGNGLAIDAGGTAYMTWSDELYTVNLRTGAGDAARPAGRRHERHLLLQRRLCGEQGQLALHDLQPHRDRYAGAHQPADAHRHQRGGYGLRGRLRPDLRLGHHVRPHR